jgi:hypothetical protein
MALSIPSKDIKLGQLRICNIKREFNFYRTVIDITLGQLDIRNSGQQVYICPLDWNWKGWSIDERSSSKLERSATMERFPWVDWEETQWNDKCTTPPNEYTTQPKIPVVRIDGKTGCLGLTCRNGDGHRTSKTVFLISI